MFNFSNISGLFSRYLLFLIFLFCAFQLYATQKVQVRILQTTDIHSFIEEGDNEGSGGWLRVATLIKKHRREIGREHIILIDCGDTVQGSISGVVTKGEAAVDLLNHLKYDFWILGNHELDFGIPQLSRLVAKSKVPILNGNFHLTEPFEQQF